MMPLRPETFNLESVERLSEPNKTLEQRMDSSLDKPICQDIDQSKRLDIAAPSEFGGGSYKEVCKYVKENGLENKEVHHMPADSKSTLDRMDGPCIEMDSKDHHQTASYGSSKEAKEYRAYQEELIKKGDFDGAIQMDIEDIREKFGDKYDRQISEMLDYVEKLRKAGVI